MTTRRFVVDNTSMVTLLELSTELGSDLQPVHGGQPASRDLTGVHVSELEDPTPYLEGGELLLTTGMPLGEAGSIRDYVLRLRARGVHGLGLGLGPWLLHVPEHLSEACIEAGIDLLIIPDRVPFQSISRAFWGISARSGKADLMGSLGTQTALARAAMRLDAASAVIRGLAQELDGWAAYLPADSSAETSWPATFWPASVQSLLPRLRAETLRLNRTGVHSAATFQLKGRPVVEYPIADGEKILGFLAVGPGRVITAANRQIILTVCTLLAIKTRQRHAAVSTAATFAASVAKLLLQGHPEAARTVAEDAGLPDLPPRVRILALQRPHAHTPYDDAALLRTAAALPRADGLPPLGPRLETCQLRHQEPDVVFLVLTDHQTAASSESAPGPDQVVDLESAELVGGLAAALSEPILLSEAASEMANLRRALRHAPAGTVVGTADAGQTRAQGWVRTLSQHRGPDLVSTVAAYLRHRGHWENVARELSLHRNSVRHRIGIAQSLLGVDLNDPDVFAPLWLALR